MKLWSTRLTPSYIMDDSLCGDLNDLIFQLLDFSTLYSCLSVSTQTQAKVKSHCPQIGLTVSIDAVQRGYIQWLE